MKKHTKSSGSSGHRLTLWSVVKILGITIASLLLALVIFLLVAPYPSYSDCFRTLEELEIYTKNSAELVPLDSSNTIKPEFNNYYKKFTQTYSKTAGEKITWLCAKIGLKKQPLWSISAFKKLLERATKIHTDKNAQGNFVTKIEGTDRSKFIVFGNIQGALHSLTRDLIKLKELGIIDNNFKITQPNYYIIFNGDIIDRSPYTLESLTVALKLITTNPEYVIYIRGHHEEGNYWQEHTLKAELLIRASAISKETIPLEKEINSFFSTLPLALYISMPPHNNRDFVRISRFGFGENQLLEESKYTEFLQKKSPDVLASYVIKDQATEDAEVEEKIKIRALIKAEKKRQEFQAMEGLRLLPPDQGITSWNVLSCPTVVYGTALKFFNDAFVIITPGKTVEDWDITLYFRDRREKPAFTTKSFNFIEGTKDGKPAGEDKNKDKEDKKDKSEKPEKKKDKKKTEEAGDKPDTKDKQDKEETGNKPENKDGDKQDKQDKQDKEDKEEKKDKKEKKETPKTKASKKTEETQDKPEQDKQEKEAPKKEEPQEETKKIDKAEQEKPAQQITIVTSQKQPTKKHPVPIMIITPPNVVVQQVTIPDEEDAVEVGAQQLTMPSTIPSAPQATGAQTGAQITVQSNISQPTKLVPTPMTIQPVTQGTLGQAPTPITSQNPGTTSPSPATQAVPQNTNIPAPIIPITSVTQTAPQNPTPANPVTPTPPAPETVTIPVTTPATPPAPEQVSAIKPIAFIAPKETVYAQENPLNTIAADNAQQYAQQLLAQSTDIILFEEPPSEQVPISPFYR